ncbi:AAA family ATPase [Sinorhizobium meliloti]|uniref:AAA family ATPase n=1 Tax=Rhizobium meliloti TaxID=382 RepID=UPI00299E8FC9|nr:AAA family ATPase [Sinorhizobium meliloti]MDX0009825.1 AAA family ATPase [Sinorhizobium meliloti]MDX0221142.1 AAA family ATPase [Sinorhizobium meliloti]MDX0227323.1 AAA family ATPase [Sinorhizobium meliloti]
MGDYHFDLMAKAASVTNATELHPTLLERPFQLFYPSTQEEVEGYVADRGLQDAANVAISTGRALLLTGEPGTGKTTAATWIAGRLGLDLIRFQVKSNSRAQDLLYEFNAIDYFRAAQIAATAAQPAPDKGDFVVKGPLWNALEASDRPTVLLIDEIDKAPRDFPNDLLFEIDRMEIVCHERGGERVRSSNPGLRPIVVITSNSERRLPEPFLRRCVYHHIVLDAATFAQILDRRLQQTAPYFTVDPAFREAAQRCFFDLRSNATLQKKPSISEFWLWFVLVAETPATHQAVLDVAQHLKGPRNLPYLSTLLKFSDDIDRLP